MVGREGGKGKRGREGKEREERGRVKQRARESGKELKKKHGISLDDATW